MKRLYTRIIAATGENPADSNHTLTGLLAAFLTGILCCMLIEWLMF